MKLAHPFAVFALALSLPLVPLYAAPEPGKESVRKEHTLPKDKEAAVITLDFKGGFTPPRISDKPTFTILADGTVKIPAKFQGQKAYDSKISMSELQELLDFAIETQKFFEYDPKKVQEKVEQANQGGLRIQVADAATTVIRIQADGKDKEVSHYALGMGAKVEELKRLAAVQQRLMQVMSTVQIGGKEKVAEYLKQANAELKAKHPNAEPLTTAHFQTGSERADGSRFVQFTRQVMDAKGEQTSFTAVSINESAQAKAQVTVNHVEAAEKK